MTEHAELTLRVKVAQAKEQGAVDLAVAALEVAIDAKLAALHARRALSEAQGGEDFEDHLRLVAALSDRRGRRSREIITRALEV